jgi:hypothetical protein
LSNLIPRPKIKSIFNIYRRDKVNDSETSHFLKISRNTLKRYLADIDDFRSNNIEKKSLPDYISHLRNKFDGPWKSHPLFQIFPLTAKNIQRDNSTRWAEWIAYRQSNPEGYCFTTFAEQFSRWCHQNDVVSTSSNFKLKSLPDEDLLIFKKWKMGRAKENGKGL